MEQLVIAVRAYPTKVVIRLQVVALDILQQCCVAAKIGRRLICERMSPT